jgi:hypothetical protein
MNSIMEQIGSRHVIEHGRKAHLQLAPLPGMGILMFCGMSLSVSRPAIASDETCKRCSAEFEKFKNQRKCRRCGCTQKSACIDERLGTSCCWVETDLCSACLTKPEFERWAVDGDDKPSRGKK